MKKLNLMAYAAIICAIVLAMSFGSCSRMDAEFVGEPIPQQPDTTHVEPEEEPVDTLSWKSVMGKTLDVNEARLVTSTIIGQKYNGEPISRVLQYVLGAQLTGPDTIRTNKQELTVAVANGRSSSIYGDFRVYNRSNYTDSLRVVTTTTGMGSNYYPLTFVTERMEGSTRINGKDEVYKNATEVVNRLRVSLYRDAYEIERGDSIYLREEVKNESSFKFHERTFSIEKKVVVDHFLRLKEKEQEEPAVEADYWVYGLGRLVSLTKCLREDRRLWCDVALLEGSDGYTMIIDTYDTEGKFVGREVKVVGFEVCPKSGDYDGVLYVTGGFYPGKITYDSTSRGWVIASRINGKVEHQNIDPDDAVARGIKNFKNNNTAYPWPYMTSTSTSKEVNGKKVITVSGKTSVRAYRGCVVADTLLKK